MIKKKPQDEQEAFPGFPPFFPSIPKTKNHFFFFELGVRQQPQEPFPGVRLRNPLSTTAPTNQISSPPMNVQNDCYNNLEDYMFEDTDEDEDEQEREEKVMGWLPGERKQWGGRRISQWVEGVFLSSEDGEGKTGWCSPITAPSSPSSPSSFLSFVPLSEESPGSWQRGVGDGKETEQRKRNSSWIQGGRLVGRKDFVKGGE